MACRGHIENGTVVLDEPADMAEGAVVTVELTKPEASAVGRALLDLAGLFPPEDLREIEEALQHCRKVDADGW